MCLALSRVLPVQSTGCKKLHKTLNTSTVRMLSQKTDDANISLSQAVYSLIRQVIFSDLFISSYKLLNHSFTKILMKVCKHTPPLTSKEYDYYVSMLDPDSSLYLLLFPMRYGDYNNDYK